MSATPTAAPPVPARVSQRAAAVYALMLVAAVGLFFVIRAVGEAIPTPAAAAASIGRVAVAPKSDALLHVLVALAAVIAAGGLLGWLFARVGQPPVIGEVV